MKKLRINAKVYEGFVRELHQMYFNIYGSKPLEETIRCERTDCDNEIKFYAKLPINRWRVIEVIMKFFPSNYPNVNGVRCSLVFNDCVNSISTTWIPLLLDPTTDFDYKTFRSIIRPIFNGWITA